MRPVRLAFCGINSFSEPAAIDFARLTDYGIFGIFGDTGSGKSTILDCIVYALYGTTPRLPQNSYLEFINYRCAEAYIDFTFEIVYEGRRRTYRVLHKLKRQGTDPHTVTLTELTGEGEVLLSASVREAFEKLKDIIGLDQNDFSKCIALPQGEFSQFVKAAARDRLRLIAGLFDLEKYGLRLTQRVNERCGETKLRADVLDAKLQAYEDITEEGNKALAGRIASLKGEQDALDGSLKALREQEKEYATSLVRRREAEEASARLAKLEAKLPAMEELGRELSRLEKAVAVCNASRAVSALRQREEAADAQYAEAGKKYAAAAEACKSLAPDAEEKLEAEIAALGELSVRAQAAEEKRGQRERAAARLAEAAAKLAAEGSAEQFSYETERRALEEKLAACGQEDFFTFAETHGKAALLRKEYAGFSDELDALTRKYPVIAPDSVPLSEKYRDLSKGEKTDISALRRAYEAREEEKRTLHDALNALEKKQGAYALKVQRIAQLNAEKARAEEELARLGDADETLPSAGEIRAQIEQKQTEKRRLIELARKLGDARAAAETALAAAEERKRGASLALGEGIARYREAMGGGGFSSPEEAERLVAKYGTGDARGAYEQFMRDHAVAKAKCAELPAEDLSSFTEEGLARLRGETADAETARGSCIRELALAEDRLAFCRNALQEKNALEAERAGVQKHYQRLLLLKKLVESNRFVEFVAEEYLQTIAVNASARLLSLTGGRYFLRYEKGFTVGDNFNGGQARPVYTLSGGETFLVSLSLALALGTEICARSLRPIEFFFLDEGFGTLDSRLVDTVMDSLEKLRSENLTIGIISHVEELKNRIDRKLTVEKATEESGSKIKE